MPNDFDNDPERYPEHYTEREPLDTPSRPVPDTADAGWGWWWMWVFFFALFLFAGWGWWRGPEPRRLTTAPTTPSTLTATETNAAETGYLGEQLGKDVTLNGQALRTMGAHAFILSSDSPSDAGQVLVITHQAIQSASAPAEDQAAQSRGEQPLNIAVDGHARYKVEGKVQTFNQSEIQKTLGAKLDGMDFSQYEGKPVLLADSVKPLEEAR